MLSRAGTMVRGFYICLFFIVLSQYDLWHKWLNLTAIDALWPVAWMNWIGLRTGVAIVIASAVIGTSLPCFFPQVRFARVAAAVGVLLMGAFWNSFGSVMHGWHSWIFAAIVFAMLPSGHVRATQSLAWREHYLRAFTVAQAWVMLGYTLSGIFKIAAGVQQMANGQAGSFHPEALSRHTAYRVLEGVPEGSVNIAPWIVEHPYIVWPMYLAFLFIESTAVIVAFRPALHRLWGLLLILIHICIYFSLSVMFSWQIMLVGVLFLCSPIAPNRAVSLREIALKFPLVGDALAWLASRKSSPREQTANGGIPASAR
ncbi:MAG TPA: hypothetical protein PK402_06765 [Tepidisphaeraceae bacterium]|nr:hypothetical protein [Tepidisphaeraceae bacterium]